MARYTITYKCGHTTEMQLFGKHEDRERKIAYYKTVECPECRAKAAQKEDDAKGLLRLAGSAKQIAWASDIRKCAIANSEKLYMMPGANKDNIKLAFDYLLTHVNSAFWIENEDGLSTRDMYEFARTVGAIYVSKK